MGKISKIAWTHSTFNPWWGCTEVSPGCDECYARKWAARLGYKWGRVPRRFFGDKHWNEPLKWERKAKESGHEWRVFCASMADIFDKEVEQEHRERLWDLIGETPHLTWLLLTKRIGNVDQMVPRFWIMEGLPENVWFGITVVNQEEAERDVPKLIYTFGGFWPGERVLWLSIEPQLGPVTLQEAWVKKGAPRISWVVTGGESGSKARPYDVGWARDLIRQCKDAGVACFVKQLGNHPTTDYRTRPDGENFYWTKLLDGKADDPEEWPEDLRVREFPNVE